MINWIGESTEANRLKWCGSFPKRWCELAWAISALIQWGVVGNGVDEELGTVMAGGCRFPGAEVCPRTSLAWVWKHPCGTRAGWRKPTPAPLVCEVGEKSWLEKEEQKTVFKADTSFPLNKGIGGAVLEREWRNRILLWSKNCNKLKGLWREGRNLFLKFCFIFNWRIITLQFCVGFCHTSAWISHRYICPLPPGPPIPPHPSKLSWPPELPYLLHTANSRWLCYIRFPLCPKVCSLCLRLHCCPATKSLGTRKSSMKWKKQVSEKCVWYNLILIKHVSNLWSVCRRM